MDELIESSTGSPEEGVSYDGSWERAGRSPLSAALLGLLAIGVLYFNVQSLLTAVVIVVSSVIDPLDDPGGNYFAKIMLVLQRHKTEIHVVIVVTQFLFMLLPTLWVVRHWHTGRVRHYLRLQGARAGEVLLAVAATICIIPSGAYIANALMNLLHVPDELLKANAELFTARSLPELCWLVVVIALTPAICEEIFFRGYVQRTMERAVAGRSVIIVGVAFGLFHLQPLSLISLSILGLVFGYFFYRSKSLLPSMAAHFTNNALAVLSLYTGIRIGNVDLDQIPLAWVIASFVAGALLLFWFQKITERNFRAEPTELVSQQ